MSLLRSTATLPVLLGALLFGFVFAHTYAPCFDAFDSQVAYRFEAMVIAQGPALAWPPRGRDLTPAGR